MGSEYARAAVRNDEEWRPIVGYEGWHEISSRWRITPNSAIGLVVNSVF
jgi:hypothetical protein